MHPKHLSIADFTYELPDKRIANFPLAERDQSKLLVFKSSRISEDIYKNIADHLPKDCFLVFNDTKVIEARVLFTKPSGGNIEIFCLEPAEKNIPLELALATKHKVLWKCMVGGASKWKPGQVLEKLIQNNGEKIIVTARYIAHEEGSFIIELSWTPVTLSFIEVLHLAGAIPLPPYIKRKADDGDAKRYQTIYAKEEGSVAAPTAGLHFTDYILNSLKKKNISINFLTLHVGAGTFKPVKSITMQDHEMHAEFIDVSKELIENLIERHSNSIVAVGTTSLRTIESLYWLGVKLTRDTFGDVAPGSIPTIDQWEPYEESGIDLPFVEALQHVLNWMRENNLERIIARTQIIIAPTCKPKIVNALVTNFHQPHSTLLLLVAALIGEEWKRVYDYALQHDFRFLSYGDGCLLWVTE